MIFFKINGNSWKTSIGSQVTSVGVAQSHSLALAIQKRLYIFVAD